MPKVGSQHFKIGEHRVGSGAGCFIVGEVAQAHDGSLGLAHDFIDAIAEAGADAVKFQTHIADAESTPEEPWRVKFSFQDNSRYEYWKRMEFSENQWHGLKRHAEEQGLVFLSSPFSVEAVEMLQKVGVPAWKVASGELKDPLLFERIAETGLPVLLSTGMSSLQEIDEAVALVSDKGLDFAVFQCTSAYPCPPEQIGLNLVPVFRKRYNSVIGLSDHSGTIYPGLAAAVMGIDLLEVHVVLCREMSGPDEAASLTIEELRRLVEGVRFVETMSKSPVDKDALAEELQPLREVFFKSVVARINLRAGTVIEPGHLTTKKPGTGIPAERLSAVVGRRLRRDVKENELLREQDLV